MSTTTSNITGNERMGFGFCCVRDPQYVFVAD